MLANWMCLVVLVTGMQVGAFAAQPAAIPARTASASAWSSLSPQQQADLAPLASIWSELSEQQRMKWQAVIRRPSFQKPEVREKLQRRMRHWASLSTQQRAQARLNFSRIHRLPPEERQRQWQAYQELPASERQRLMLQNRPQTGGAATPTRSPDSRIHPHWRPGMPMAPQPHRIDPLGLDPNTLLPK
jgi:hypothetical protein